MCCVERDSAYVSPQATQHRPIAPTLQPPLRSALCITILTTGRLLMFSLFTLA